MKFRRVQHETTIQGLLLGNIQSEPVSLSFIAVMIFLMHFIGAVFKSCSQIRTTFQPATRNVLLLR